LSEAQKAVKKVCAPPVGGVVSVVSTITTCRLLPPGASVEMLIMLIGSGGADKVLKVINVCREPVFPF